MTICNLQRKHNVLSTRVLSNSNPSYSLIVRQQPSKARLCSFKEKGMSPFLIYKSILFDSSFLKYSRSKTNWPPTDHWTIKQYSRVKKRWHLIIYITKTLLKWPFLTEPLFLFIRHIDRCQWKKWFTFRQWQQNHSWSCSTIFVQTKGSG